MIILHRPFDPAMISADFKSTPHDFIVTENMDITHTEEGEHLWLYICKVGMNTAFVAELLAKWANIPLRDVGYSGLKDRHAKTYQWFSLRLPKQALPEADFSSVIMPHLHDGEALTILHQHWHHKKLGRGTHKSNTFTITLRHIIGDKNTIEAQLSLIAQTGVPNYFGQQRFGIDDNNIHKTKQFFEKILASHRPYKPSKKDIHRHSLYISTAKSLIFNALLSQRVRLNNWDKAVQGDVFNLDGTNSIFCTLIDESITQRIQSKDIHPTAPLFGVGELKNTDESLAIYRDILNQPSFELFRQGLLKVNTKLTYRPLRLHPQNLSWQWHDNKLTLNFSLPSGTFATSVLFALCNTLHDKHDRHLDAHSHTACS